MTNTRWKKDSEETVLVLIAIDIQNKMPTAVLSSICVCEKHEDMYLSTELIDSDGNLIHTHNNDEYTLWYTFLTWFKIVSFLIKDE